MEEIQCIFCHTPSDWIVIEENGYKGRKCLTCGLVYISPRPNEDEVSNLYAHNQAHISAQSHLSNEFLKRLYAKHHLSIIKKYIKRGSLLELGAGAGYFLDEARKMGFDVYGIELNPSQANFIRNKLGIPCEDRPLNETSFGELKSDVIYHSDVVSHFYDPISEFKKMNTKLKDDGILVLETGNFGDVEERYYSYYITFQLPDHLFFFSIQNLETLLRIAGFEILKIYRYSILFQLFIKHTINRFWKIVASVCVYISPVVTPFFIKRRNFVLLFIENLIKNTNIFIMYVFRYWVGKFYLKRYHPQTVVIIAQKVNRYK